MINPMEDVKRKLNQAMTTASGNGMGIIGFVVTVKATGLEFEPFSSSAALKEEEFVELIALASRQMIAQDDDELIN